MTNVARSKNGGEHRRRGVVFLVASVALLILALVLEGGEAVARAWLVCFALASGLPVGGLVLLMVHRLTGGDWGRALAPVLKPAARNTYLLALAFVPLGFALGVVYGWSDAAAPNHPYLNAPFFLGRAAVALIGWSILGVLFGAGEERSQGGRLAAALGLIFYGLSVSLVSIDWFLSIDPRYTSTTFGAMTALGHMLTALAVSAVLIPQNLSERNRRDLAAFLIAAILGLLYLGLMTFIVSWYGNLPDKARWWLARGHGGWGIVATLMVGLAGLAFALLLLRLVRTTALGLRVVGVVTLLALALHFAWLIAPSFASQARVVVAAIICGLAVVAGATGFWLNRHFESPEPGRAG